MDMGAAAAAQVTPEQHPADTTGVSGASSYRQVGVDVTPHHILPMPTADSTRELSFAEHAGHAPKAPAGHHVGCCYSMPLV